MPTRLAWPAWWWGYCGIPTWSYTFDWSVLAQVGQTFACLRKPTERFDFVKVALAEVNLDGLLARFVRDYDLLWHIASFLFICCFCFINSARPLAISHSGRAG